MAREVPRTDAQKARVDEPIPVKRFAKGDVLLREGEVARRCWFTIEGCVRAYRIVDGEERTTAFYTEGDPIAPLVSYLRREPSDHALVCVEACTLGEWKRDAENRLYREIPGTEALCRAGIEEAFAAQQAPLADFVTKSAETRYRELMDRRPELAARVPQYLLASYLRVRREPLSRIRQRLARGD